MADKRIKFYPPKGGEPVIANPEYREQLEAAPFRFDSTCAFVSAPGSSAHGE